MARVYLVLEVEDDELDVTLKDTVTDTVDDVLDAFAKTYGEGGEVVAGKGLVKSRTGYGWKVNALVTPSVQFKS